jgi:predicted nucleic acid-binding protein
MRDKLFDASALLNLMLSKKEITKLLSTACILDLTPYEVGNALLRLSRIQKSITWQQAHDILEYFSLIKEDIEVRLVHDVQQVKKASMENGLSFYDSAYLVAAKQDGLVLVTDDDRLASAALRYKCKVLRSDDI